MINGKICTIGECVWSALEFLGVQIFENSRCKYGNDCFTADLACFYIHFFQFSLAITLEMATEEMEQAPSLFVDSSACVHGTICVWTVLLELSLKPKHTAIIARSKHCPSTETKVRNVW